jgi:predicted outer membrane repeat protein
MARSRLVISVFTVLSLSDLLAGNTIFVDRNVVGGTQNGTSWSDAYRYLQNAIIAAGNGDEIWVVKGFHYPDEGGGALSNNTMSSFRLKEGVRIYGGFAGTETFRSERDPIVNKTTLSGDIDQSGTMSGNAFHVVKADGSITPITPITPATILDGFTVASGNASGYGYEGNGGGLLVITASPTINNCTFQGNSALSHGGGVQIAPSSAPIFNNCTFRQNNSSHRGGGVTIFGKSSTIFNNCSFEGNTAGKGGGIYNYNSALPTLNGCSFLNNSATFSAGAVYNDSTSSTIINCTFHGNSAGYAGAIENNYSPITLTGCTFYGNRALTHSAGAIYFQASEFSAHAHALTGCFFRHNSSALDGGAIRTNAPKINFTGCSFEGNQANSLGGGICVDGNSNMVLTNTSFQGNSALGGGAIFSHYEITLTNCSYQGNIATNIGGAIFRGGSVPAQITNCLIWNNKDSSGTGTATSSAYFALPPTINNSLIQGMNPPGRGNLDGTEPSNDPGFVAPTDPANAPMIGGDLRLLDGSPAIDVGDEMAGTSINNTDQDLSGRPRFAGNGTIDIGAYEGGSGVTFAWRHPTLLPDADDNRNGISNFGDYAAGGGPDAPDDPSLRPVINGELLSFSFRNNANDLSMDLEKSDTITAKSWSRMVVDVDFNLVSSRDHGASTFVTIRLFDGPLGKPNMFYRQAFRKLSR